MHELPNTENLRFALELFGADLGETRRVLTLIDERGYNRSRDLLRSLEELLSSRS
ncbi:MAG TPA: hypothetical protein VHL58_15935 [Thermoanaerobaculia bacterium]|nr:hypothetical protein [Thermoanaerobaculia bacterium]